MMKSEYKLQPIRIPSGWTIEINNFYEVPLTAATADWYCASVLISGFRVGTGACFDSRVEPEGDPNGEFVVEFFTMKFDEYNNALADSMRLTSKLKTRNRLEFIEALEQYMFMN